MAAPDNRNFEIEGEAIESGLRRSVEGRNAVMRSLIRAVYRFRDATLVAEKKDDFGSAIQNLYRSWNVLKSWSDRADDPISLARYLSLRLLAVYLRYWNHRILLFSMASTCATNSADFLWE